MTIKVCLAMALLLLCSCSRQRNRVPAKTGERSGSASAISQTAAATPPPASLPQATAVLAPGPPAAVPSANPSISQPIPAEPKRPSPFAEPSSLIQRETTKVAAKVPLTPSAGRPGTASRYGTVEKPFVPPAPVAEVASIDRGKPAIPADLPPPPALPLPPRMAPAPLPGHGVCCVARATYEPVRPHLFGRMLQKVPGLRRLRPNDDSDTFLPPHPLHDITFVLPRGSNRAAFQKRHIELKANVDESGTVTRVELLAPKDEELVTLAADAAGAWKFAPARLNDKTVPSQIIIHFWFDQE